MAGSWLRSIYHTPPKNPDDNVSRWTFNKQKKVTKKFPFTIQHKSSRKNFLLSNWINVLSAENGFKRTETLKYSSNVIFISTHSLRENNLDTTNKWLKSKETTSLTFLTHNEPCLTNSSKYNSHWLDSLALLILDPLNLIKISMHRYCQWSWWQIRKSPYKLSWIITSNFKRKSFNIFQRISHPLFGIPEMMSFQIWLWLLWFFLRLTIMSHPYLKGEAN